MSRSPVARKPRASSQSRIAGILAAARELLAEQGVALGFERREEEMDLSTDAAFATGDLAGQGGDGRPVDHSPGHAPVLAQDHILECQRRLAGYHLAVEFRHRSWFEGDAAGAQPSSPPQQQAAR